jgi:hypothetical protein
VRSWSLARVVLAVLCISLAAYLLSPALTAVHVEGFSGQIQSLSIALAGDGIASHDPYLPLITEFIFLTRAGVVDLLALMHLTVGIDGDEAFRTLTVTSLATLIAASVAFARTRGSVRAAAALAAVVLTPGLIETGFFFNDNIVSAAFACLALALLTPAAASWRYLLSGALAGAAVLCRLDAVFALPFLAGIVLIEIRPWPRAVRRVAALAGGFLFTVAVSVAVNRVTIVDSLSIGAYFNHVEARGYEWRTSLAALLFFFGPVTPMLLATGILRTRLVGITRQNWPQVACFVVYPLLLTAFAMKTGREVRYLYPLLAPVIALHGGGGVEWILEQLHKPAGERRVVPLLALLSVMVITFCVPPSVVAIADGPRALFGRIWSPVLWWRWQRGVGQSMAQLAGFVDRLDREPATLVLTSHWNDEFFLRLRLSERGYINTTAAETFPGCDGFSVYTHGQHRVFHLRLHNEYYLVPYSNTTYGALAITRALVCPAVKGVANEWVTTFGSKGERTIDPALLGFGYERFQRPLETPVATDWLRGLVARGVPSDKPPCCSDGLFDAVQITAAERMTIDANARAIALSSSIEEHSTPAEMFAAAREANRGRSVLTRDRWP